MHRPVSNLLGSAVTRVLEATATKTEDAFLLSLVEAMTEVLGISHAFVGCVDDHGAPRRVATVACWSHGEPGDPFEYDLAGTPCEQVVGTGSCLFRTGVREAFPEDEMLVEMRIEGYIGVPIRGERGVLGLLVGLGDEALQFDDGYEQVLELFAARAGAELERREYAHRLAQSEARYRQIVTNIREGVWTIDADARTTFVNERMAHMLGYRESEMVGRSMYDFMDEQAQSDARRNEARRKSGAAEHHPFRLRKRDGSEAWVTMAATPLLDAGGQYAGALALVTDLTVTRRLDERVQQAQKQESLGALSAGIAHDFNNLLTAVLGNLDFALLEPDAASRKQSLEQAKAATLRAASLTRQLLAYAGRGTLEPRNISMQKLLRELPELVKATLPSSVELSVEQLQPDCGVLGEEPQLVQVLLNLVLNAGEAVGRGPGRIDVRCRLLDRASPELFEATQVGQLGPGPYVELRVSDDGVGMAASTRSRIFEPFFSSKGHGRGLGLAGVAGIVRRHDGAIVVESEPGRGTDFVVLLPAAERPEAHVPSRPPTRLAQSGTVLVVDDEPAVRMTIRRMLSNHGYDVEERKDGLSGLDALLGEQSFAFAVVDVAMPGCEGFEVIERAREAGCNTPVVIVSGHATDRTLSAGVSHLMKPFSADDLWAAAEAAGCAG